MPRKSRPSEPSNTGIRRGRRHAKYQNRIFFAFLCVVAVPLLLLGVLTGFIVYRQNIERNDTLLASAQENVEGQAELVLSHIIKYYTATVSSDAYRSVLESRTPPNHEYRAVRDLQIELLGGYHMDEYVMGYTCINLSDGWLLSNLGTYPLEQVSNRGELMELLDEWDLSVQWVNRTDVSGSRRDDPPYTVPLYGELLVIKHSFYHSADNCLIVQLNLTPFYEMTRLWTDNGYSIVAVDTDGKTVLSTSGELADIVARNRIDTGISVMEGWRIDRSAQQKNGLTYYAAIPQSDLLKPTSAVLLLAVIVAAAVVLALILCRRFSTRLYQPIGRLVQAAGELLGQPRRDEEEFDYLMAGVAHIAQDQQAMQKMMTRQKRQLQQNFVSNLIRSEVTAEAAERMVEELSIQLCPAYRLVAVSLDAPPDTSGSVRSTMLLTVLQQFPQTLDAECVLCPTMVNYTIILVVGGEESELPDKCRAVFRTAMDCVHEVLGLPCRGGVSLPFHRLHHLSLAAHRAWEALRLPVAQMPDTSDDLIYYRRQDDQPDHSGYDEALEHEIIAAVTDCKAAEADALIGRFVTKLKTQGVQGYEWQLFIQRLIVAVLAVAEDVGLSINQIFTGFEAGQDLNIFNSAANIYSTDRLQQFLMENVAEPVIGLLTDVRQRNSGNLVEKVLELIHQTRGDITLTECADQLNYNSRYIWKVLRTELDTSFSDLVGEEKLERAKELLSTTDMTVVQVAETLNYSNVQNFIRFFSKKVGMTPGKYKKDYSEQE